VLKKKNAEESAALKALNFLRARRLALKTITRESAPVKIPLPLTNVNTYSNIERVRQYIRGRFIPRVWELVPLLARVKGRIIAPADGAGACALACALLGKECYSSDSSPILFQEGGLDFLQVHCEDYSTTLAKALCTDTVVLSHCMLFCCDAVTVALRYTSRVLVYDKERLYEGCNRLINCSKEFVVRCSPDLFQEVGFLVGRWEPKILSFLTDEMVGHGAFGIYGKKALPYLWYLHRLGLCPSLANYGGFSDNAFQMLHVEYGFPVVAHAEVHLIESFAAYTAAGFKIDLNCGYVGWYAPKVVSLDQGGDIRLFVGEYGVTSRKVVSSYRGVKWEQIDSLSYCYPRKLGKKFCGEIVLESHNGDSWGRLELEFQPKRRRED